MAPNALHVHWLELSQARRAIVMVDVVESTRLIERAELDVIRRWLLFVHSVDKRLARRGGRKVKSTGDGMLLEFLHVPDAVAAGMAMHRGIEVFNRQRPPELHLQLRIGLHVGDIFVQEDDIYGTDVNLAARLCGLSRPGDIVVSSAAFDLLVPGLDADVDEIRHDELADTPVPTAMPALEVQDMGECFLKNLPWTTRAYRLRPARRMSIEPREARQPSVLPAPSPPRAALPTLAVLPFETQHVDARAVTPGDVFADGAIVRLSRHGTLNVISRMSSTALKGRRLSPREVGALLGVDYLLAGRCLAVGQGIHLFAELIDAREERVVVADATHCSEADLFHWDSDPYRWVEQLVPRAVVSDQLAKAMSLAPANLDAYALELGAVALMHRSADAGFQRSHDMLQVLVERHPTHATPRAWLAKWHVLNHTRGRGANASGVDVARFALGLTHDALELDPGNALCHAVEGFVRCHMLKDLDAATDSFSRSLDTNPNESLACLFRGVLHAFRGEGTQAVNRTQQALALSPIDPIRYYYLSLAASATLSARDYPRTIELASESWRLNRVHSSTLRALAIAQVELGDMAQARDTMRRLLELEPDLSVGRYLKRLPVGHTDLGREWADALQRAGLPA